MQKYTYFLSVIQPFEKISFIYTKYYDSSCNFFFKTDFWHVILHSQLPCQVYPPHKEDGRFTRGVSEFRVKLRPDNKGALFRRTLDYSSPNQTAEVFIMDICSEQTTDNVKWEYVFRKLINIFVSNNGAKKK